MKPISPRQLQRLFPNASKATLAANSAGYGTGVPDDQECDQRKRTMDAIIYSPSVHLKALSITITGQIRGGKNNMGISRTGKHYPKEEWAKWRDEVVREIESQLPDDWKMIDQPTNVRIDYVAGDKRRRDFPAICDSIWHCLEKAGFCKDDTLLWPAQSSRSYDKQNPRTTITILE